ncbi:MAG: hypothetical protein CYPHOPRED_001788 [Cyphobasidiales sp. Tagirdzhanova-0007]|nr:MAG: hypothetical protein CYPHOPRED_001788 [Cyphobasidiales sp. Tagirdzhanova-0007]
MPSNSSNPACSPQIQDTIFTYYDTDHAITNDTNGTEAYNCDVGALYSLKSPISTNTLGGVLQISAGKKDDRGHFTVSPNDVVIGVGDAYDASCIQACQSTTIFEGPLSNANQGDVIKVMNVPDSRLTRGTPFLDLDHVTITPNC